MPSASPPVWAAAALSVKRTPADDPTPAKKTLAARKTLPSLRMPLTWKPASPKLWTPPSDNRSESKSRRAARRRCGQQQDPVAEPVVHLPDLAKPAPPLLTTPPRLPRSRRGDQNAILIPSNQPTTDLPASSHGLSAAESAYGGASAAEAASPPQAPSLAFVVLCCNIDMCPDTSHLGAVTYLR
jgi:hypothetical protein